MIAMKTLAGFVTVAALSGAAFLGGSAVAGPEGKSEMASKAVAKVGEKAPAFTLTDTDGNTVNLSDFEGKVVVLEWFNPECPYVVKHHEANSTMADLANEFVSKDVVWVAINSGAPGKHGAGLEASKAAKDKWDISYPILIDETGQVGKSYGAKTTPHMYIIDKDGTLKYAGAIDNNPSAKDLGDVNFVRQA